jgi:hypothetical protein
MAEDTTEYTPMADVYAPPEEEKKTYEGASDADAVRAAADDLAEARAEPEPVQRQYMQFEHGLPTDRPVAENETVTVERASEDVTRLRDWEAHNVAANDFNTIATTVDQLRGEVAQAEQPQQPEQPQAEQPQQQPATDEEALRAALERPAVRQALEQQLNAVEAQRVQYSEAANNAFNMAAAATFSQYEELRGVDLKTLPHVLAAVQKHNPERAAAMVASLTATQRLHDQAQQAQRAQNEIAQAKQAVWVKNENARFDDVMANEPKEVYEAVTKNAARLLKQSFGIEVEQLAQMVKNNPGLRSAEAQSVLYQALKSQLTAEEIAAKKAPANIPPVQRPGVSRPASSYADDETAAARKTFDKNPSPETAAAFLQARRAARNR